MTDLPTTITAVTVYPDRARVTRKGSLHLESGLHHLQISGLPVQINAESVRASARSHASARLYGVQLERAFFTQATTEQIRSLEAQVEAVQDDIAALDAQAELLKAARLNLEKLAGQTDTYAMALASGEMSVEAQIALFEGLRQKSANLNADLQASARSRRELERQLQKLKSELELYRGAPRRESFTAQVEVEMLEAGELEISLSYVVSGAGWQPLYDLRLIEDLAPSLEVGYLAQVTQRTGEAWENIALTLSTARPALSGRLPDLAPWYIYPRPVLPPMPEPRPRSAPMAMKAPAVDAVGAPPEMMQAFRPAEEVTASVDSSGAAVTYGIGGSTNIPADGGPHKVTVARFRLPPRLDYAATPKLGEAVYRRAKLENSSSYTFLPGAANLFAGEEFIGATRIDLTAPGGELELFLGVDDRIKVERKLVRREVDKKFIGGKGRLRVGYEIKLENALESAASLHLEDQIPVSRNEEVKVKLESTEPQPKEISELGILAWDLTLAAHEKRTLRFDFSVEYPQGMDLLGLP